MSHKEGHKRREKSLHSYKSPCKSLPTSFPTTVLFGRFLENLPTPASDLGLEQSEARIDKHRQGKCMRRDIDLHEPIAKRCWKGSHFAGGPHSSTNVNSQFWGFSHEQRCVGLGWWAAAWRGARPGVRQLVSQGACDPGSEGGLGSTASTDACQVPSAWQRALWIW